MFCFAEGNKINSGRENTITEPDWVVDWVTTYCFPREQDKSPLTKSPPIMK
jgi:hypothetical protein